MYTKMQADGFVTPKMSVHITLAQTADYSVFFVFCINTGLTTIGDTLTCRHLSLFGQFAWLQNCMPCLLIEPSVWWSTIVKDGNRTQVTCIWDDLEWTTLTHWLHHIQQDLRVTPSTAWDSEVARGHRAVQRSQTMGQWWRLCDAGSTTCQH